MRLLIVTSQFPIAGEPNRGRPIHQTVQALSALAEVRVISPVARYPRWAMPRSSARKLLSVRVTSPISRTCSSRN